MAQASDTVFITMCGARGYMYYHIWQASDTVFITKQLKSDESWPMVTVTPGTALGAIRTAADTFQAWNRLQTISITVDSADVGEVYAYIEHGSLYAAGSLPHSALPHREVCIFPHLSAPRRR